MGKIFGTSPIHYGLIICAYRITRWLVPHLQFIELCKVAGLCIVLCILLVIDCYVWWGSHANFFPMELHMAALVKHWASVISTSCIKWEIGNAMHDAIQLVTNKAVWSPHIYLCGPWAFLDLFFCRYTPYFIHDLDTTCATFSCLAVLCICTRKRCVSTSKSCVSRSLLGHIRC